MAASGESQSNDIFNNRPLTISNPDILILLYNRINWA
jgi:hypothetical protein